MRGPPPGNRTPKQEMARKLATLSDAAAYAKRKWVVEPVFGQIEMALICATHNLLKLHAASV